MAVLLPIWSTKRVTAGRVRQRIGAVVKWAVAQGCELALAHVNSDRVEAAYRRTDLFERRLAMRVAVSISLMPRSKDVSSPFVAFTSTCHRIPW